MGFLVLGEGFGLGIPIEFASELVADIGQLAKGGGAMSGLDVSEGLLARTNAVEPVGVVALGLANFDGGLEFLYQVYGVGLPWTAVDPDGAFGSVEYGTSAPVG